MIQFAWLSVELTAFLMTAYFSIQGLYCTSHEDRIKYLCLSLMAALTMLTSALIVITLAANRIG